MRGMNRHDAAAKFPLPKGPVSCAAQALRSRRRTSSLVHSWFTTPWRSQKTVNITSTLLRTRRTLFGFGDGYRGLFIERRFIE